MQGGGVGVRRGAHADVLAQVRQAREVGDPVGVAEALNVAHHCLLAPEHSTRRLLLAGELLQVSSVTGRRVDALLGLVWRTVDLFLCADPRAERSLSELRTMLAERDHGAVRFVAAAFEVMLDVRAGRFEAVEVGFFAALAMAAAASGDRRTAAGALARLGRLADLCRSSGWLVVIYGATEAAARSANGASNAAASSAAATRAAGVLLNQSAHAF